MSIWGRVSTGYPQVVAQRILRNELEDEAMRKRKTEEDILTKKEVCHLLRIKLKNLGLFERNAKLLPRVGGYTNKEYLRLYRSVVNFYGIQDEEKGLRE